MKPQSGRGAAWLAPLGTALAIVACYGTLATVGLLSLIGITIAIPDGIWPGLIVFFALLALAGTIIGWRRHDKLPPLLLGIAGAGLVLWAMTVSYSRPVEIAGFVLLVLAAGLDWRARRHPMPSPAT